MTASSDDRARINKAFNSIRTSKNEKGESTFAAFVLKKLESATIPTDVKLNPTSLYSQARETRDSGGKVTAVTVTIGVLGLAAGPNRYPDGSIARLDTVLVHEFAHTYGFVFENGVGLSNARAMKIENEYRSSQGYEQSDPESRGH
jgi:hypothetical protein